MAGKRDMKYTVELILISLLSYLCGRLRNEYDRKGWVKIRSPLFHMLVFPGGYWKYRPCDIVIAAVGEIGFLTGIITLFLPLTCTVREAVFCTYYGVLFVTLIPSFIIEAVVCHRRDKEADLVGNYLKSCKKKRW